MPRQRKNTRSSKGVAMDKSTWQLLQELANNEHTNISNLIEKIILEKYGKNYDENGNTITTNNENPKSRIKKTK